jgi:hypothetical protein
MNKKPASTQDTVTPSAALLELEINYEEAYQASFLMKWINQVNKAWQGG